MIQNHEIRRTATKDGPAHTHLVWYPRTPGAEILPNQAACSYEEACEISRKVLRGRHDLKDQDVRITLVSNNDANRLLLRRAVTVYLCKDLSIGKPVTIADLNRYGRNMAQLLEKEYPVRVTVKYGQSNRTECDDGQCLGRIESIERTNEWTNLLK
jgi:hypothetical protein